jgi:hypothetical protein
VPTGRLPLCCSRRHAPLHRTRRRQTLPARGLLEVRCRRTILQGAWRGQRCQEEGCSKAAVQDGTDHCRTHGGGRRCQHLGCPKPAAAVGTQYCKAHGGGRRCQQQGCSKSVARAPSSVCLHAVSPARAARRCVGRCSATASQVPGARATGGETSTGGGWRVRGHPRASDRSDVQDVYNIERRRTPQHRLRRNCHGVSTLLKAIEESLASTVDIGVPPRPLL